MQKKLHKRKKPRSSPKLFRFTANIKGKASGLVWAKDEDEAVLLVGSLERRLEEVDSYEVTSVRVLKPVA